MVLSKPLGDVKAGGSQTCISSTNGLQCLGQWRAGLKQLLPADARITDFSVGNLNVSAIANSALFCWGANDFGQLGDGNTTTLMANAANAKSPTQIHAAGSDVESIPSGATDSCLLIRRATKTKPSRALTCWGNNGEGQFGSGVSSASRLPTDVFGTEKNITAASVDGATKCIVADGGLQCWGTKLLVSKLDSVQRIDVGYDATPQQIIAPDSDVTFVATRSEGACAVVAGGLRC